MDVDNEYDEYFDEIDDKFIESLNEIEQKNASNTPEERPAKRQKLHHPGPESFELDELPEISVQNNFYSTEIDTLVSERNQRPPTITRNSHANANSRPQLAFRNSWNARHSSTPSSASVQLNSRTGSSGTTPQLRRGSSQRSASRLALIASALATSETPTSIPAPPHAAVSGFDPSTPEQSDTLKKKLDELDKENTRIQNLLREAQDARFAKEGEVTVLRRNMDKVVFVGLPSLLRCMSHVPFLDCEGACRPDG
ncbi:hypothetical protein L218DRAFT_337443 [Marasmius fiardii PR-910]|nr:hypothetical protein L218DRAFT_337443 [Marasmius fiardii PR-910]